MRIVLSFLSWRFHIFRSWPIWFPSFNQSISFIFVPNCTYLEQPTSFAKLHSKLPSWLSFTILFIISTESYFVAVMCSLNLIGSNAAQSTRAVEYTYCISAEGYDIKQSDGEAPGLEIWGTRSNHSLPSLPGPLRPGVVPLVRALSIDQIELFNIWNVCKQMTGVNSWCNG